MRETFPVNFREVLLFDNYAACDHRTAYPGRIQTKENTIIEIIWEIARYKNFLYSRFFCLCKERNLQQAKICIGKSRIGYP